MTEITVNAFPCNPTFFFMHSRCSIAEENGDGGEGRKDKRERERRESLMMGLMMTIHDLPSILHCVPLYLSSCFFHSLSLSFLVMFMDTSISFIIIFNP